jgi:hypothetical protein
MHRKRYERMKARILSLETDLPPKLRAGRLTIGISPITRRDGFPVEIGESSGLALAVTAGSPGASSGANG